LSSRPPWGRDVGFAILLLLVLSALFPSLVFGGHVLFERDLHQMLYAQYASLARILRQGSWPIWDPWPGFGQPMIGNPAAQVLYPPTWFCLVLEPGRAYTLYLFLHLVVGALAVRALAGRFGASPVAAAGAGIAWMLSGPILSLANLWHHLAGASLMPVVWLAADGVLRRPDLRGAILWGGATGLQVLAGSFDMCLLTGALTGPWWLYARRDPAAAPPVRRLLPTVAVAGGVALALGAGLLLPAFAVWRGSARQSLAEGVRAFWSLHPALLLQVSLPVFPQGLPLPPETRSALFEAREPFLASIYLGLACLPLMAAALLPRARRPAPFLAVGMVLSALLALGRHGLAYPALVAVFPPLTSLRYPVKVTAVMALCGALLVGLGLDALRETGGVRRLRLPSLFLGAVCTLAALVLAVALLHSLPAWLIAAEAAAGPGAAAMATEANRLFSSVGLGLGALSLVALGLTSPARRAVLVFLVALELGQAHRDLHATAPAVLFATPPAIVSHLRPASLPGTFTRIHAWDYMTRVLGKAYRRSEPDIPARTALREVPDALATALARHDFLSPPTAARFGLYGSFDRDWLGLQPRGVRNLGLIFQAREETPDILRLLQAGGVSHVVSLHEEGLEALAPVATETSRFAGQVHLLRVEDPLPRAYAVGGVAVADGILALQTLLGPDFDPRASVILPTGVPARAPASFTSNVRIADARPDRIRIEAVLGAPGYVVLLDAWDSGWRALVDGRDAVLERANVGFRAVGVPAGSHAVEFIYRPRGLSVGLALSAGAAVLVLGTLVKRPSPVRPANP